ncbi:hypothetical protein AQUCO_00201385v1 [Aquilegia coerulea]|uniref:Uncharacterized protein n=1 Tax=Aquilegia coerulea TaxID=218851 RepID=A0A2G5F810_AQUCA|nr:hypothetical protein AQUCO_00201385v1 [Aquilegia coerulea]PIA64048.1 hypothetical protein AQUCO_00201385v1 [Aquilegia coerulea]PIA64049.1 hypothetical protein AQUCO_00201385v1 [Aquilegia coerulea]PIA64050.1 hypothetical protein AQUCO_00201385v1 [Aquilegia coerulea]
MSTPYERAKAGRLIFKGGTLANTSKSINKKKKKKNKSKITEEPLPEEVQPLDESAVPIEGGEASTDIYTIDAAKKMKYDELFPVEARKFGYDPKAAKSTSVEQALDDRVKKKADRYCK